MQGKVEICGVNTSRLGTLPQAEMDQLLRKVRQGDEEARDRLIEGNLRLVLSVIQRFAGRGENPDDLFRHAIDCAKMIDLVSNGDRVVIAAGVPGDLVRLSCGIEHYQDLIDDIRAALDTL